MAAISSMCCLSECGPSSMHVCIWKQRARSHHPCLDIMRDLTHWPLAVELPAKWLPQQNTDKCQRNSSCAELCPTHTMQCFANAHWVWWSFCENHSLLASQLHRKDFTFACSLVSNHAHHVTTLRPLLPIRASRPLWDCLSTVGPRLRRRPIPMAT